MTRKVSCACCAEIPFRNITDYYRLTPQYAEIRRERRFGIKPSQIKNFLDLLEQYTQSGVTILKMRVFAEPHTHEATLYRNIVIRCQSAGYLKYVCPKCERTIDYSSPFQCPSPASPFSS